MPSHLQAPISNRNLLLHVLLTPELNAHGPEENFAGNIIVSLAGLPEFLRKPILRRRMSEFPGMSPDEQDEIVGNALDASPGLPFPVFAKLFETWLEVLSDMDEDKRSALLEAYARGIAMSPAKVATLHMDGLVAVFVEMMPDRQKRLSHTIRHILHKMNKDFQRKILLMTPDTARAALGI